MTEQNGFYYMRARYYDPQVGRFVSEDPIGFAGGDVNLMAYVNQPVNRIDPSGLINWNPVIGGGAEVIGGVVTVGVGGVFIVGGILELGEGIVTGAVDIGAGIGIAAGGVQAISAGAQTMGQSLNNTGGVDAITGTAPSQGK